MMIKVAHKETTKLVQNRFSTLKNISKALMFIK